MHFSCIYFSSVHCFFPKTRKRVKKLSNFFFILFYYFHHFFFSSDAVYFQIYIYIFEEKYISETLGTILLFLLEFFFFLMKFFSLKNTRKKNARSSHQICSCFVPFSWLIYRFIHLFVLSFFSRHLFNMLLYAANSFT